MRGGFKYETPKEAVARVLNDIERNIKDLKGITVRDMEFTTGLQLLSELHTLKSLILHLKGYDKELEYVDTMLKEVRKKTFRR